MVPRQKRSLGIYAVAADLPVVPLGLAFQAVQLAVDRYLEPCPGIERVAHGLHRLRITAESNGTEDHFLSCLLHNDGVGISCEAYSLRDIVVTDRHEFTV